MATKATDALRKEMKDLSMHAKAVRLSLLKAHDLSHTQLNPLPPGV